MGKLLAFSVALVAVGLGVLVNRNYLFPPKVRPPPDGYFGAGSKSSDDTKIVPFTINVSDAILQDLNTRLDNIRFYDPLDGVRFEYGMNTEYLRKVHKYWRNSYDWRKAEAQLNQFSHFKTEIEGLKVHFIDEKPPAGSKYKKVLPLLLVHGWPGSVYEFYKILPMLTDPKAKLGLDTDVAFHVIAPSIPGYGWSDPPRKKGGCFGVHLVSGVKKIFFRIQYDSSCSRFPQAHATFEVRSIFLSRWRLGRYYHDGAIAGLS